MRTNSAMKREDLDKIKNAAYQGRQHFSIPKILSDHTFEVLWPVLAPQFLIDLI